MSDDSPRPRPEFGTREDLDRKLDALGEDRTRLFQTLTDRMRADLKLPDGLIVTFEERPLMEARVDVGLVPYGPPTVEEQEKPSRDLAEWCANLLQRLQTHER